MTFLKGVLVGAASGLVPAIIVDIHSYKNALEKDPSEKFNWKLAIVRWIYGALSGAATGAGLSVVG